MTIRSTQIADAIAASGTNGGGGAAVFLAREANRMGSDATLSQRKFLNEMMTMPKADTPGHYPHPRDQRDSAVLSTRGHTKSPLTPTEVAWLNTLPTDPSKVSHDDAVTLSTLADAVPAGIDSKLVQAHWQPVAEYHDREAEKVAQSNARITLPPVPSSAASAIADAIRAEVPELSDAEALARARQVLEDALTRRNAKHARTNGVAL